MIQACDQLPPADVGAHAAGLARCTVIREADAAAGDRCMEAPACSVARVGGTHIAVVAAVRGARDTRPGHADVVGRTGIAVLAGRAVRHRHVDARARRGIALAGLVTLIERRTHHRRAAAAGAGVTDAIVLGAGARVVAGHSKGVPGHRCGGARRVRRTRAWIHARWGLCPTGPRELPCVARRRDRGCCCARPPTGAPGGLRFRRGRAHRRGGDYFAGALLTAIGAHAQQSGRIRNRCVRSLADQREAFEGRGGALV